MLRTHAATLNPNPKPYTLKPNPVIRTSALLHPQIQGSPGSDKQNKSGILGSIFPCRVAKWVTCHSGHSITPMFGCRLESGRVRMPALTVPRSPLRYSQPREVGRLVAAAIPVPLTASGRYSRSGLSQVFSKLNWGWRLAQNSSDTSVGTSGLHFSLQHGAIIQ